MRVLSRFVFSQSHAFLTLGIILVVVILCVSEPSFLNLFELKTYDFRFLSRGRVQPLPSLVLALIDEKSLTTEGRWPWPRSKLATLVEKLSHDGARVIGFDMAFLEPDENPQNDLALMSAIQQSSAAVVLGYFFLKNAADFDYHLEQQAIDHEFKRLSSAKYPFILSKGPGLESAPFVKAAVPKNNLTMFTAAAAASGHLSLGRDQDDVVRSIPLIIQGGEEIFPPLAIWCAWHYLHKPKLVVHVGHYGAEGIQMGERFIPTNETGQLLINYLGPPKTFPHVSISDILSGRFPQGTFTDKIVLVGTSALGTHALLSTPFGPLYPAVEVHATVIDNILTQNFLMHPTWSKMYDLGTIIALGTLTGIALPRLGLLKGLGVAAGLFLLHTVMARWLFVYAGVWLTTIYPFLVLSTTYVCLAFHQMAQKLRLAFRSLQDELAERQRAEEALRQSEAHYRALVEGSLQGIAIVTREEIRIFANSALAHMLGYEKPEELFGRSIWEHVAPHEVSRLRESFTSYLQGEPAPMTHEYQAVKKDGALIWVDRLASPMTLDGKPVVLETYIDITESKRLEIQLRQAHKMQAIGTLAGGIAHDFNNILTPILGYTELAMKKVEHDKTLERYLQHVMTAGRRAQELVRQILAFSRQTEATRIPVQMHLLIKEVLGLLRAALPATITIQQGIDSQAGTVLADPTQIHQVILNLCTNAAHAMRATGGVIEVLLEPVEVALNRTPVPAEIKPGPYVRMTVRDTGHGMAPEIMERVFEPFFTTKSAGEGTGMGLAMVYGIVTGHQGAITVESTPGQGTTFAVYLPRVVKSTTATLHKEEARPGGSEHILFVDDEEALAALGQETLQALGYSVVICTSSSKALDVFRATPQSFDLVITDYAMPAMTGEVLAAALRCVRSDIPIILCTGFSDTMTAERADALGIDGFVLKPWIVRELDLVIRQVLARRLAQKT